MNQEQRAEHLVQTYADSSVALPAGQTFRQEDLAGVTVGGVTVPLK